MKKYLICSTAPESSLIPLKVKDYLLDKKITVYLIDVERLNDSGKFEDICRYLRINEKDIDKYRIYIYNVNDNNLSDVLNFNKKDKRVRSIIVQRKTLQKNKNGNDVVYYTINALNNVIRLQYNINENDNACDYKSYNVDFTPFVNNLLINTNKDNFVKLLTIPVKYYTTYNLHDVK